MAKPSQIIVDLFDDLLHIGGEFFTLVWQAFFKKPKPKGYTATLTEPRRILSKRAKGFCLGGVYSASTNSSFQHLLVSAGSGLGKSTTVAVPTLFRMCGQGSFVVLDPSGENFFATAGYFASQGYRIRVINFSDRTGAMSDGWNPMPLIDDLPNFISKIVQIGLGTEPRDPFWNISAESFLTTLARVLYKLEPDKCTIANLLHLLNNYAARTKVVDEFMSEHADAATWTEYLAFNNNSENVRASVVASAKAALKIFGQQGIQRITSFPTFNLGSIRKYKTIIYVQTNAAELVQYKLPISLFFDQLITAVLSRLPSPDEENIWLILDEAGVYPIDSLFLGKTQGRKMRLGIATLVQTEQQLYALYGREQASTIISNCYTRMYLTNQPITTAREIEEITGKMEYEDEKGIRRVRSLLTSDEIRSMEPNKAIVLHGHHRPAIVPLKPYFKNRRLKRLASMAPPNIKRSLPEGPVPLICLNEAVSNHKEDESSRS